MSEAPIPAGKSKHTPGPWRVAVANRGTPCVISQDTWICGELVNDGGEPLEREEGEANAELIAAAPDMLAALRAVNKLISEAAMTGFNCHDGDWAERLFFSQQATSQAIRKAEGRP